MNIDVQQRDGVTVVAIDGEIDATTAPAVQQKVLPLALPGCRLVLDLSKVHYMSSAGLRLLLSSYRQVTGAGGRIALAGLAEEIRDMMSITGFLSFFTTCPTVQAGVEALTP